MNETRRTALKILGAVSATCAFPFAGDELYGQHAHPPALPAPSGVPYAPTFFTPAEYRTLSRLADLIIPPTDTPGAVEAGVPAYIDLVVSTNAEHQPVLRAGLAQLDRDALARGAAGFVALDGADATALLRPAADAVDRENAAARQARFRADASGKRVYYVATTDKTPARQAPRQASTAAAHFFRLVKSLTADGYYTSRIGLIDELGYTGNTAMLQFPSCVPEA